MKHKIFRKAIPHVLCEYLATEYRMIRDNVIRVGGAPWDPTVPGAFAMYSPICFEALSAFLHTKIEDAVGLGLYPSYTYSRIYKRGCELKRHKDRQSSEYSVSCCISKDKDWPLTFEYDDGTVDVELNVGDIVIFQGLLISEKISVHCWRSVSSIPSSFACRDFLSLEIFLSSLREGDISICSSSSLIWLLISSLCDISSFS